MTVAAHVRTCDLNPNQGQIFGSIPDLLQRTNTRLAEHRTWVALDYLERCVLGSKDRAAVFAAVEQDLRDISLLIDSQDATSIFSSAETLSKAVKTAKDAAFAATLRANATKVIQYVYI